jgi:hypothetical protein
MPTYEELRAARMASNAAVLAKLGVGLDVAKSAPQKASAPKAATSRKRRATAPAEGSRRSARARGAAPVSYYAPPDPAEEREDHRATLREQVAKKYRLADGRWRGERFGEVAGVAAGDVFGGGDYQRLGRRLMSDTGFFEPFVTPEWLERNGGCYALILNNDNGLSKDRGDTVLYAGAGGRMRGQNRTAPQTFSQTWDSATNKALRLNCERKLPVRVVRGPKLRGGHGTGKSGGGYRYDGLYDVVSAEMVHTGSRKLKTAMFTLQKRKGKKTSKKK